MKNKIKQQTQYDLFKTTYVVKCIHLKQLYVLNQGTF